MLLQLPLFSPNPDYTLACVFGEDGMPNDWIGNFDTAIVTANEGYYVYVLEGTEYRTREEIQQACDYERELVADCFGADYLK